MEFRTGSGTGAGNVAAVLWNLRFDKYDVQQNVHL